MQNKVVRFVLELGPRTHVGQEQRNELGLLSVKDRVAQLKLNRVFKIYHGLSPDYLNVDINRIRPTSLHNYSTRDSPYNFTVPRIKGQANNTFFYSGIQHWNSLPNAVQQRNEFSRFKKATKNICLIRP